MTKVTIKAGSGYCNLYGVFMGRVNYDTPATVIGPGRYPIESKVQLADGTKMLIQKRFFAEEDEIPENIYATPFMRQSVQEDRNRRRYR